MAREEVPMSIRRLIVEIDKSTINIEQFCAAHGVSTWFFHDLRRRYAQDGDVALTPRSRAPHRVANKTPLEIEDLIVAKRKELDDAGLDAGAETIAWHLREVPALPSPSTMWRILRARGFITADPTKAPKGAGRSFTAERANDCWQLDDTSWELADGTGVKIFNVIDDHSRLLVASVAMSSCTGAEALAAVASAAPILGWPARILSDNAKAFRHVLADALAQLGVGAGHSRPYHPQTNGKVERFHKTLKQWLTKQHPATDLAELQHQLDCFQHLYNHQRPHRSLDRHTPASVWEHAPKNGPADRPLTTTTTTIHHSTVHEGRFPIGNRYRITIGNRHNGATALTIITGTNCHVFINGHLERALTLDPTRRDQPLHNRLGRPPTMTPQP